jgi:hypothetical protein
MRRSDGVPAAAAGCSSGSRGIIFIVGKKNIYNLYLKQIIVQHGRMGIDWELVTPPPPHIDADDGNDFGLYEVEF